MKWSKDMSRDVVGRVVSFTTSSTARRMRVLVTLRWHAWQMSFAWKQCEARWRRQTLHFASRRHRWQTSGRSILTPQLVHAKKTTDCTTRISVWLVNQCKNRRDFSGWLIKTDLSATNKNLPIWTSSWSSSLFVGEAESICGSTLLLPWFPWLASVTK